MSRRICSPHVDMPKLLCRMIKPKPLSTCGGDVSDCKTSDGFILIDFVQLQS
jgi:hypothetical protein